jgi:hypothetical protein
VLIDWATPPESNAEQQPARWRDEAIVRRTPFTLRAWSAGVCNIMETTCDGVDGNTPERAFNDD